jgi:cysteinyl-tRNA synthetase
MATKYLGQPFDIHTGGIDLIPTHHQNEIAQSEAAYDKPLANYWLHGEFVVIGKDKMAKSGGNFITLKTIKEKGIPPLAYRYLILNSHYRSPLNFTDESLAGAQNGLNNLYGQIKNLGVKIGKPDKKLKEKFLSAINDDLNTAKALATLQEALKSKLTNEAKLATALDFDKVLGLRFKDTFDKMTGLTKMIDKSVIPNEIQKLADERKKAKDERNYPKADKIREKILGAGYEVKDLPDGTSVYYKK